MASDKHPSFKTSFIGFSVKEYAFTSSSRCTLSVGTYCINSPLWLYMNTSTSTLIGSTLCSNPSKALSAPPNSI